MTDIEVVNPVPIEEVRPWVANMATTFLTDPVGEEFERWIEAWRRDWPADRIWGARDGGRWVGTLATDPRILTVPGHRNSVHEVVTDAVTAVTVNATHRRRGVLTQMLTDSLRTAKDRGDAVGILIAAEWPIYGRFGYSPASQLANCTFFPRTLRTPLGSARTGTVRQVEPAEVAGVAAEVFDKARLRRQGQVDRPGDWWSRQLGMDGYQPSKHGKSPNYFLHEGTDGPDGLLWWSAARDFELKGELGAITVGDFMAGNDDAYRNLWAYLAGIDVVGEVSLERRPTDEPIRWLLNDGRALRQTYAGDDLWVRLLDVPAALSARGYAASGQLVLDVVDDAIGSSASGRYLLDADDSGAACRRTTAGADLRIAQRALASIYLGGFTLREMLIGGSVEELTSGALARADAMFATTLPPWNATGF